MSHNANQAPLQNHLLKRQRLNSDQGSTANLLQTKHDQDSTILSPLEGDHSLDLESFANALLQPKHIQQRFLRRLNSVIPSENLPPPATPSIYNKQPGQEHNTDSPACAKDENDEDMFSDISIDDLEQVLAGTEQFLAERDGTIEKPTEAVPLSEVETTVEAAVLPNTKQDDYDDDDMFDDIPDDLLDEALRLHNQGTAPPTEFSRYQRFMVAGVHASQYDTVNGTDMEKVLSLTAEDERFAIAKLRGNWTQTIVKVGDIIHIPTVSNHNHISNIMMIDDTQGYIIIHPDRLISCTAVAESSFCLRRSVLQHKIKSIGDYSVALVHGNIIHRIMQGALQSGDFSLDSLQERARAIVETSLDELLAIGQDEDTAYTMLNVPIQTIHSFGKTFVSQKPKRNSRVTTDMGANVGTTHGFETIAFSKILDVEEHLWSPTYGLKGMVDVSVEMKTLPTEKTITVPLELKTGKNTRFISHRAQTILYTLLMSDRYGASIDIGALYYSRTNSLYITPATRNELQLLLMARNNLASAINNRQTLPPMTKNLHYCQQCPLSDACLQHHKAVENGTAESSGLGGWFTRHTDHISDAASKFYRHWLRLIDLEEEDIDYIRKDIWRQTAEARERVGKCFANMVIDPTFERDSGSSIYRFCRKKHDNSTGDSTTTNLLHATISVGDPIVVSSAEGHINLGMGFVLKLDKTSVVVNLTSSALRNVPRRRPEFIPQTKQVFDNTQPTALFRIDRDEMSSGVSLMRRNMVSLLGREEDGGDAKRRRLIVELQRPLFEKLNDPPIMPASFNPSQQQAVEKVLAAKDYAIILGMPGTGKTTTTAHIICTLVERGKSVLLTSYTHSALDNVLHKVHQSGVDVLRLGNPEKVSDIFLQVMPSLRSCMPNSNPTLTTVERLERFYNSKKVVGVTCLGIGHNMLLRKRFDYCIVDEASQITLPACVGPLRFADVFVLVGDQYQLPPLVRNAAAREEGLSRSLFELLAEEHPEAVAVLEYQYRMNADIMSISNKLIYDNRLKCASAAVADRQIALPRLGNALVYIHDNEGTCKSKSCCWIEDVIDPRRKVVFINTDEIVAEEERAMELIHNPMEAKLVIQLAEALLAAGVPPEDLAVISVYRSQLRLISHALRNRPGVESATIDKYQGRDKDCILVSLVRSNDRGNTGDLLRDWRRINVAFTRAKSKIIVIGSKRTLETSTLFSSFLDLATTNGWIYELKKGAEMDHIIEPPASPERPSTRERKTFIGMDAFLKTRPILRDVYNSTLT